MSPVSHRQAKVIKVLQFQHLQESLIYNSFFTYDLHRNFFGKDGKYFLYRLED